MVGADAWRRQRDDRGLGRLCVQQASDGAKAAFRSPEANLDAEKWEDGDLGKGMVVLSPKTRFTARTLSGC